MITEQESFIQQLITREKKAKINWVMAVTLLHEEELRALAEKLHFVIKGEYIALPSEAENIREANSWESPSWTLPPIKPAPWKPDKLHDFQKKLPRTIRPPEPSLEYNFCSMCGIALRETGKAYELTGFCPSCGVDLMAIFSEEKFDNDPYSKLHCNDCGNINPKKAQYCFHCGSNGLSTIL